MTNFPYILCHLKNIIFNYYINRFKKKEINVYQLSREINTFYDQKKHAIHCHTFTSYLYPAY